MKNNELINYRIQQAQENAGVAELLFANEKYNAAVNRVYYSMYSMLLALASRYEYQSTDFEQLVSWFNTTFVAVGEIEKTYLESLQRGYDNCHDADIEVFVSFTKDDVIPMLSNLKEYLAGMERFILKSPDLVPETLFYLKVNFTKDSSITIDPNAKQQLEKLNSFLKENLLSKSPLALKTFDEFVADVTNQKLEATMQARIEDHLEEMPDLKNILEDIIIGIKKYLVIDGIHVKEISDRIRDEDVKGFEPSKLESSIMVPYDFTPIANYAVEHAVMFIKNAGGKITLLNIVKKEKEVAEIKKQLEHSAQQFKAQFGIPVETLVKTGSIFTDINTTAAEMEADLVIMGTHGIVGMQKITGSWALKVIAGSKVPYLVVQAPPAAEAMRSVLFPVDPRKENKQKLNEARYLSKIFNLKFFISHPAIIATAQSEQKVKNNVTFSQHFFASNGVESETVPVAGCKDYFEATMKNAKKYNPDLILIVTTKDISIQEFILGVDEQKIIANELKIPVMCVNPVHAKAWNFRSGTQ